MRERRGLSRWAKKSLNFVILEKNRLIRKCYLVDTGPAARLLPQW
jgi:hypothetical protein